jgi:YHS domain-containing protein
MAHSSLADTSSTSPEGSLGALMGRRRAPAPANLPSRDRTRRRGRRDRGDLMCVRGDGGGAHRAAASCSPRRGDRRQPCGGCPAPAGHRNRLAGQSRSRGRCGCGRPGDDGTWRRGRARSGPRVPPGYVGLVAIARRARAVLERLRERGVDEEAFARVRSPAGLDLGPLPQPEIAVAVLAELVAWRHARTCSRAELLESVDPVCGMTVAVGPDTPQAEYEGTTYWFCCLGCRSRFAKDPAVFLASA